MKKLLLALTVIALLAGCQQKTTDPVIISGTASNYSDSLLFVTVDGVKDTISVNEDGTFSDEVDITKPGYPVFQGNRLGAYIWLTPGKTLTIDFDAADFGNTVNYGGDLGDENNYLKEKNASMRETYQAIAAGYQPPNVAEDFKRICDSVKEAGTALFAEYQESYEFDEDFVDMETKAIEFGYLSNLQTYPDRVHYYNKEAVVPDDWSDFMDDVVVDDPQLLDIPDGKGFVNAYVNEKAIVASGVDRQDSWGNPDVLRATFDVVENNFMDPGMVDALIFGSLKQQLDSRGNDGISDLIERYLSLEIDDENRAAIEDLDTQWSLIAPGANAPAFTVVDMEGNEHSLADFKGQYVYIDFWATWCGPCKVEIPHLVELHNDYKERNIAIMSISVDKDKKAWEDMVTEEGYEWLQFHDGVNMNDLYLVRFIPTFVLIDTEGKVIKPRAPRPSQPELRELLEDLADL